MSIKRIRILEEQIRDIKARWPVHSVPAQMYEELEELEDKLDMEIKSQKESSNGCTE